jgi:hypothetical protein
VGETIDWQALLDGHAKGFVITVHGARIGDGIDAISLDRITFIEPQIRKMGRRYTDSGIFNIIEDGQDVAAVRAGLLAELRQHGGCAFVNLVKYDVVDARIRKIRIRGLPLQSVPFAVEADIERMLGPASGIERVHGCVVHHFPERGLSVAWHVDGGRVEHVALGPVEWTPPVFSASDVLREWVAAACCRLAPEWNEPEDRTSSQWVRHARVTALLHAFELGSPQTFADGRFLEGRPVAAYPRAGEVVQKTWGDHDRDAMGFSDILCWLFSWLLRYRSDAERLLRCESGLLVAHSGTIAGIDVTRRATNGVVTALAEIDALLTEMIAPGGKQITEREMIERWGWPEVDLDQLEQEELI